MEIFLYFNFGSCWFNCHIIEKVEVLDVIFFNLELYVPHKDCGAWVLDVTVYNKMCSWYLYICHVWTVVFCLMTYFSLVEGYQHFEVCLHATLKTRRMLLQNNGTDCQNCIVSWFTCCENVRANVVCNSLQYAEKLLVLFVNCSMNDTSFDEISLFLQLCWYFFTAIICCGCTVIYEVLNVVYITQFHLLKALLSTEACGSLLYWKSNSLIFIGR
jgi:hypothetical protein